MHTYIAQHPCLPVTERSHPSVMARTLHFMQHHLYIHSIGRASWSSYRVQVSRLAQTKAAKVSTMTLTVVALKGGLQIRLRSPLPMDEAQLDIALGMALNSMNLLTAPKAMYTYAETPFMALYATDCVVPYLLAKQEAANTVMAPLYPQATEVPTIDTIAGLIYALTDIRGNLLREAHNEDMPLYAPKRVRYPLSCWGIDAPLDLTCDDITPPHRDRCLHAGVMCRHIAYRLPLEVRMVEELR